MLLSLSRRLSISLHATVSLHVSLSLDGSLSQLFSSLSFMLRSLPFMLSPWILQSLLCLHSRRTRFYDLRHCLTRPCDLHRHRWQLLQPQSHCRWPLTHLSTLSSFFVGVKHAISGYTTRKRPSTTIVMHIQRWFWTVFEADVVESQRLSTTVLQKTVLEKDF